MEQATFLLFDNYANAVNIAEKYLDISNLDDRTKDAILYNYHDANKIICEEPIKRVIKFFTKELSDHWSSWTAVWVELFWKEIYDNKIQLKRTDNVVKLIERKRFLSVDEATMFNKNWAQVLASGFLSRYTDDQIRCINELIRKDKEKRLDLLIKSLRNERVSCSDYFKYGEAISYFTGGKLFCEGIENEEISLLFNKEEVKVLKRIWQ